MTGAQVERGFSGAAVHDPQFGAVVGMIVESDREVERKIAQATDVPSLWRALGRTSVDLQLSFKLRIGLDLYVKAIQATASANGSMSRLLGLPAVLQHQRRNGGSSISAA